eukprot:COSAG06_NODE_3610_length_5124_cov_4.885572_1_plen_725_part_10
MLRPGEDPGAAPALAAAPAAATHEQNFIGPPAPPSLTAAPAAGDDSFPGQRGPTLLETLTAQMGGRAPIANQEPPAHEHLGQNHRYRNSSWRPTIELPAAAGAADAAANAEPQPTQRDTDRLPLSRVVASPGPEALATSSDNPDDATKTKSSRGHFESLVHAMDRCETLRQEIDAATSQAAAFTRMLDLPAALMPGSWRDSLCHHFKAAHSLRRAKHRLLESEFKNLQTELQALRADGEEPGGFMEERLQALYAWSSTWTEVLQSEVLSVAPPMHSKPRQQQQHQQAQAQQLSSVGESTRSRYVGVHWNNRDGNWQVKLRHEGIQLHLGSFAREQEDAAARAYDAEARELRGSEAHGMKFKLNFPTVEEQQRNQSHPQLAPALTEPSILAEPQQELVHQTGASGSETSQQSPRSRFTGVSWNKRESRWMATIGHEGRQRCINRFAREQEEAAARACDDEARRLRGSEARSSNFQLDFPTPEEEAMNRCPQLAPPGSAQQPLLPDKADDSNNHQGAPSAQQLEQPQQAQVQQTGASGSKTSQQSPRSRFIGVSWTKSTSKRKVSIRHEGRNKHVGYFAREQEEAAARAYDDAARQLRGPEAHSSKFQLNFPTPEEERNQSQLTPALALTEPCVQQLEQPQQAQVQQTGASGSKTSQQSPRSRFTGVSWSEKSSKWRVEIGHEGRNKHVGYFAREQEEAAARAYDDAARQLRGPEAHSSKFQLNFPT